jgi:hypothetical protein
MRKAESNAPCSTPQPMEPKIHSPRKSVLPMATSRAAKSARPMMPATKTEIPLSSSMIAWSSAWRRSRCAVTSPRADAMSRPMRARTPGSRGGGGAGSGAGGEGGGPAGGGAGSPDGSRSVVRAGLRVRIRTATAYRVHPSGRRLRGESPSRARSLAPGPARAGGEQVRDLRPSSGRDPARSASSPSPRRATFAAWAARACRPPSPRS